MMSIIYLETLNIEWGQIDPKHNRRVKRGYGVVKIIQILVNTLVTLVTSGLRSCI